MPFSRKVVGGSMQPNLVIDALEMAWFTRNPGKKAEPIFHSDRGSQYAINEPQRKQLGRRLLGDAVRFVKGGTAVWPAF